MLYRHLNTNWNRRHRVGVGERLECRLLLAASEIKLLEYLAEKSTSLGPQAIIGGSASGRGTYGWMVSLQSGQEHFCGGTLVSQDAVVTAAHCVEGTAVDNFDVVVGRENLSRTDDGQRVGVSQIVVHPDYDANNNDSDIAVLVLREPVDADPIGYLTDSNASLATPGSNATVLGWGTTREGGDSVDRLREVTLPIVSNAVANSPAAYGGQVTTRMLAAGRAQGGIDSCQGDSGGPLFVTDGVGNPHLAGVVSWGEGCGRANKFGIYARVTSFDQWLDGIIGIEALGQVDFDQERYVAGNNVQVILRDANVGDDVATVRLTTESGDRETIELQLFSPGRYRGEIALEATSVAFENGTLNVVGSDQITVEYVDANDGFAPGSTISATALVVKDDFGNGPDDARLLETDQLAGTPIVGEIEVTTDTDWFQFEATAGAGYTISLELDGSLNDSVITLFGSDGETVLGFDDDSGRGLSSELAYYPNVSGSVFVEAAGFGANIGTYSLSIQSTEALGDDHSDIVGGATEMQIGSAESGRIDEVAEADWFTFPSDPGVVYRIGVTHRSLGDSILRLVDSDGMTELAFNDDRNFFSTEAEIYYRAHDARKLSIEVTGFETAVGTYDLLIEELDDDHGHVPGQATEVTFDESEVVMDGNIQPQDVDWFEFTAVQDRFYTFETVLGALDDSVLRVYDSTGQRVLAENDDFQSNALPSRIVWQAPSNGPFFVEVAGFGNSNGDYEIVLAELDQPPADDHGNRAALATEAELAASLAGSIDYQADQDWFEISAVAGGTYTFNVLLETLDDSLLRIYDDDGQTLLAANDDVAYPDRSSRVEWMPTATGTIFVVVSAFDGFLGDYRLTSEAILPELALGDTDQNGTVDADDIDALFAAVRDEDTAATFDLNGDGVVDAMDAETMIVNVMGTVAGDSNLDQTVNFEDFLAVARNFGQSGGWSNGDFNGNGTIDFDDFLRLSRNFGETRG